MDLYRPPRDEHGYEFKPSSWEEAIYYLVVSLKSYLPEMSKDPTDWERLEHLVRMDTLIDRGDLSGLFNIAALTAVMEPEPHKGLRRVADLVIQKHYDYGRENLTRHGTMGIAIRITDKIERIRHLMGNNVDPTNESLQDSWDDIVGYGLCGLMMYYDFFQLNDDSTHRYDTIRLERRNNGRIRV